MALFSSTTGKVLKRASATGIAKLASGVLSAVTAPSGAIVGDTDSQTLTNKTLTTPTIGSLTNAQHDHSNAAGGGTLSATTALGSGTVPTARLGSGSATSSTFLRGDQTWAAATSSYKNGATTYDLSTASGAQNIAHGLGATPKFVRITATYYTGTNAPILVNSNGVYNGTTNSVIYNTIVGSGGQFQSVLSGNSTSQGVHVALTTDDSTTKQTAIITFDGTNIILTWTKTGSPTGTLNILWEAVA